MRLAFAIVSMFPWGGLQRDCLRLGRAAIGAGHDVTIFAARAEGELPRDLAVELLPVRALSNHGRNRRFAEAVRAVVGGRFDRIVGFNKLPGLDVLYCGDLCFADRHWGFWSKLNPRARGMLALEQACFAPGARTRVLALTPPQIEGYRRAWGTPADRITLLPPPIDIARRRPELRKDGTRERMRAELGLPSEAVALLSIGSWTRTKGFDRTLAALPKMPQARFVVCGMTPASPEGAALLGRARDLGVGDRVRLLGPRADVPELMAAADLFVHPARVETAGIAILEAMINGLPVLVTETCGFASHVRSAEAGIVIAEPFTTAKLIDALREAENRSRRQTWSANGACYGKDPQLYCGMDQALQAIVEMD